MAVCGFGSVVWLMRLYVIGENIKKIAKVCCFEREHTSHNKAPIDSVRNRRPNTRRHNIWI